MNNYVGKTYTFESVAFPGMMLNFFYSQKKGENVVLWGDDGSPEQQWKVIETSDYCYKLQTMKDTARVLNRHVESGADNNNADAVTMNSNANATQEILIGSSLGNTVYISMLVFDDPNASTLYLTAVNNEEASGTAKTPTSDGNVYWAPAKGANGGLTSAQKWRMVEVGATSGDEDDTTEESDYSTGYYRFSNGGYYLTGTATSVTAATMNGQTTQTWNFRNNKLYTENSSNYGIAGTSSSTMSTSPNEVVLVSTGTNKCYIKLSGSNKYLQRSSTTVSWGTSPIEWTIEEIIKKTGTPYWGPEYFSAMAGESNGSWDATRTANLKLLFKKFYLNHSGSVSDARIGQNLYGALYSSAVPGKFHTGIDVNDGSNYNEYKIYSPIQGYVVNCNTNNGAVCIYNEQHNYTIVLMHLQIDSGIQSIASQTLSSNNLIAEGRLLGTQSGYNGGIYNDFASHLHFELHNGKYTGNGAGLPSKSYDALGSTVNPYDKIAAIVS